jgi:hypothetical protein
MGISTDRMMSQRCMDSMNGMVNQRNVMMNHWMGHSRHLSRYFHNFLHSRNMSHGRCYNRSMENRFSMGHKRSMVKYWLNMANSGLYVMDQWGCMMN